MIYLDNAATGGFKPKGVIDSLIEFASAPANPTRSGHTRALYWGEKIADVRLSAASYFGLKDTDGVIFTKSCTESLNLAILCGIEKNSEVITTENEHNSVLRPLYELSRRKLAKVKVAKVNDDLKITFKEIEKLLTKNTRAVVVNHVSNVTGAVSEIGEIGRNLNKRGITFIVDGAQSGGYLDVNMERDFIDILCLPCHKGLNGLMGLGLFLTNKKVKLKPLLYGGTGTSSETLLQPNILPEGFESGTLNAPAIVSLQAAFQYLIQNKDAIKSKMDEFSLIKKEAEKINGVRVFSAANPCGILSFLKNDLSGGEISEILNDKYGIATRSGLTCAPLIHKRLGTLKSGVCRASFSSFNTSSDMETLLKAIYEL